MVSDDDSASGVPPLVPATSGDFLSEYKSEKAEGTAPFRSYPKFDGTRFENPWSSWQQPTFKRTVSFLCSRMGRNSRKPLPDTEMLDAELPVKRPNFQASTSIGEPLQLTWIGHATSVVRMDGISIVTDPVFESVRRYREPACSVAELPDDLRLVVVSHNHYDHLCYDSILQIHRRFGDRVTFCVPKGLSAWFHSHLPGLRSNGVVELNWWQGARFQLGEKDSEHVFQVVAVPAQHWSMRHPLNRNKTLWSGWCVIGPSKRKFYFAGDTGYCVAFKEIGQEMGPIDLATIPIGAYKPRDFLRFQHVDPFEAVQIHQDIQAKQSVGIHWGTFRLGGEDVLDPPADLATAAEEAKLAKGSFVTLAHGETFTLQQ